MSCCYGCKPPKRYPGCGAHCDEFKAERAAHQEDNRINATMCLGAHTPGKDRTQRQALNELHNGRKKY